MIDIKLIRNKETRNKIIQSETNRFKDPSAVNKIAELDETRRHKRFLVEGYNKRINEIQQCIKKIYTSKDGQDAELQALKEEVQALAATKQQEEAVIKETEGVLDVLLNGVSNILHDSVVVSKTEDDNPIIRSFRTKRAISNTLGYPEICNRLGADTERGARVSGHRGYFLCHDLALLEMSLARYAVDFLVSMGYILTQTPVLMKRDCMAKTAQLSDFDEQLYRVEGDMYLIATSEQPLTALHIGERLVPGRLPLKYCGQSLCFRKEAGAHGKDNQGIFRVHQFEKIEQFRICEPEKSQAHFDEMVEISEEFYKSLDIPFNVVGIVSGEMNDAASLKYDIEAYFPHTDRYRELVSVSNCTDYQSRNLEVRYGLGKEGDKKEYVHMLNGTLCAVQRTLCCLVENYQSEEGVVVPEVLRKYMGKDSMAYIR